MALGKNLKKQQLISDKKKGEKKPAAKKKVVKKKLIEDKKAPTKKAVAKKPVAKKSPPKKVAAKKTEAKKVTKKTTAKKPAIKKVKKPVQQAIKAVDTSEFFSNFITESQQTHKEKIRERYQREIEAFKDQRLQFVVFNVGAEYYAIEIGRVKEVVPAPPLADAPNTPDHVPGIATIRDHDYMAYDLHIKFRKTGTSNPTYAMVVGRAEQSKICFLLEGIPSTLKIDGSQVTSDLSMLDNASRSATYIKGLIHHDDKLIFYLDINELVASDKAIVIPDEMITR